MKIYIVVVIPEPICTELIRKLSRDHGMSPVVAERVFVGAIAFVYTVNTEVHRPAFCKEIFVESWCDCRLRLWLPRSGVSQMAILQALLR